MTSVAEPLTVLDEQTREELQPPCEITFGATKRPCDKPAEWIIRARHTCKTRTSLVRAACFAYWSAGRQVRCSTCECSYPAEVVYAERLR